MKLRLLMLALGNFVIGTGSLVIAGILPTVAQDLRVSITMTGQAVTIYALTYALVAPLLAAFTSRIPRRLLLVSALLLFGGANLLATLSPSFELLFLTRILAALGGAMYTPTASAVAVTLAPPQERGRALALVFSGLPIATVLGLPLGTFIGSNFGWRIAFGLVAVLTVIAVVAILVSIKNLVATPPLVLGQWLAMFKQPHLVLALSLTFFQYTAQFLVFTYIAPLLIQNTKLDGTGVSLLLFAYGLAGIFGNSFGGYAADRFSLSRLLGFSMASLALVLFGLPFLTETLIWAILAVLFWGFTGFIFNPVQQSRLVGFAPQTPGLVLSLNSSMLYFGNATGAALGGLVVSSWSLQAIGWAGGVIALLGCFALTLSLTLYRRPTQAVPLVTEVIVKG